MYKVQVFYDKDNIETAIRIAAFRLGIPPPEVEELWDDGQYYLKATDGIPQFLLEAVEVYSFEDEEINDIDDFQTEYIIEEVYDSEEMWFPLEWDSSLIAELEMSNVFELTGCRNILKTFFYCSEQE